MSRGYFSFLVVISLSVIVLSVVPAFAVDPVIHYRFEDSLANSGSGGSKYDAKLYTTAEGEDAVPAEGAISYVEGPEGKAIDIANPKGEKRGAFIGVEYKMPEQGTLAMWYYTGKSAKFRNNQPLFDGIEALAKPKTFNSYSETFWEAWIYGSGMVRGRVHHIDKERNYLDAVAADLSAVDGNRKWFHFVMTWDKNDPSDESLKLYINGQLSSTAPLGWVPPPEIFCFAGGNTGNNAVSGKFDEIRVYDSVLPASEIEKLAGAEPVSLPKPVLHYKFEGNLTNSGTGGDKLNGVHVESSTGEMSYTDGVNGKGLVYGNEQGTQTDGDFVKVKYKLPDEGAISVWYKPRAAYNYNTIWDNSVECDDWECWIYWDSKVRARVGRYVGGDCSQKLDQIQEARSGSPEYWEDGWYLITFTWSKDAETAAMYVNGKLAETKEFLQWIEPGEEFYLGGGQDKNQYGVGIFDDLMIFENYLTSAQARKLYQSVLPKFGEESKE